MGGGIAGITVPSDFIGVNEMFIIDLEAVIGRGE